MSLAPSNFWALTPAEFNGFTKMFAEKREGEVELLKAQAYWSESLARTKRLPPFEKWLSPPKPARALTGDEAAERLREHQEIVALTRKAKAALEAKTEEGHG